MPRSPSRRAVVAAVNRRLRRFGVELSRTAADTTASWPEGPIRAPRDPRDRLVSAPVFVLSSVRSGSTLLRLILDSHSQLHVPHETHFRSLAVRPTSPPVVVAMEALDLDREDLEHLLWDRVLHTQLVRSGKSVLVEKTPSNTFAADRLATAWPGARFVYLLRHPYSIARSWHESAPRERSLDEAIEHTMTYMTALERARADHPGLVLRYEDLTAEPEREIRRVCDYLDVPWEPAMLEYGQHDHGRMIRGLGDWRSKIKSGRVQEGRPLPSAADVPAALEPICRAWGY